MRARRQLIKVLTEPFTVVESVSVALGCSAQEAFDFMWDPDTSRVLNDDAFHGTRLAGTPERAVGEVQVFLSRTDGVVHGTMMEVQSLAEGRQAVTRTISDTLENHQLLDILPLDEESCRLRRSSPRWCPRVRRRTTSPRCAPTTAAPSTGWPRRWWAGSDPGSAEAAAGILAN